MVKALGIKSELFEDELVVRVNLVADTKDEIEALGDTATNVVGLSNGTKLSMGSMAITVGGELGVLGSDGTWNFKE